MDFEGSTEDFYMHVDKFPFTLACGGDGTVSWILNVLGNLREQGLIIHQPPLGILPLGTGNDFGRSLGWGASTHLKEVVDRLSLLKTAQVTLVDQWRLSIIPSQVLSKNHKLRSKGSHPQRVESEARRKKIKQDLLDHNEYRTKDEPVVGRP